MLGIDLEGQAMGIYGMGRIGQAMARRARGFGMHILYTNRNRLSAEVERELGGAEWVPFDQLLRRSDVLSLHCPLTAETKYKIAKKELAMMKPTSILINTARGPVVCAPPSHAAQHSGNAASLSPSPSARPACTLAN
jgi:glyoxylate reductase